MYKVIWSNGYSAHSVKTERKEIAKEIYEAVKELGGVTYVALHRITENEYLIEECCTKEEEE